MEGQEYDAVRNGLLKDRENKAAIRRKIQDRIQLTFYGNTIGTMANAINALTDWVLNLLSSEVINTHNMTVLGLTVEQVQQLKNFYEASTGKRAEDI